METTEAKITGGKSVTGSYLKMIALVTMFIDHIGATLLWRMYEAAQRVDFLPNGSILMGTLLPQDTIRDNLLIWAAMNQEWIVTVYDYLRMIGRVAFPIYCFLLVEGFLHTRSVKKYALRLFIFALISEVPFDFALSGEWFSPSSSNVFFTLLLGLLMIWGMSYIEKFYEFWKEKQWDDFLGKMITVSAVLVLAVPLTGLGEMVLCSDYGMAGILAILIIYIFRKTKELAYGLAVLLLSILTSSTEIIALVMLIPLMKYRGERGKGYKYLFYVFYPVHLFLLGILCMVLGV